ncbi:MAG: 4-oxalocrotonate tautomerase [Methanomicrobiales archaeon HGW-Methanomicrobiales-4]|nr:MAG: 4-oxalocrotonate tautomerase [Methanomicrobiales archaeon HGW-Methanomicrobiales-4]
MPVVQITMAEGRTPEQKRAVAEKVTDVLVRELNTPADSITIFIYELGKDHIAKAGVLLSDKV